MYSEKTRDALKKLHISRLCQPYDNILFCKDLQHLSISLQYERNNLIRISNTYLYLYIQRHVTIRNLNRKIKFHDYNQFLR